MNIVISTRLDVDQPTAVVAVPVFSDDGVRGSVFDAFDAANGGVLSALVAEESFKAKSGKTLLIHRTEGAAKRVLLIGLGKAEDLESLNLRTYAAQAVDEVNARHLGEAIIVLPGGLDTAETVHFSALGAALANYRYDRLRTCDVEPTTCESVCLVIDGAADGEALGLVAQRALAGAAGVCLARDLVNGPPDLVTPNALVEAAEELAADGSLALTVFDEAEIKRRGMNLLMAVGQGSVERPRFIHLTYTPDGVSDDTPSIALVGKGITFDAGGYNIKPTGAMEDMKIDMGGAAAVLGAMKTIAATKPGSIVHGIVPTCENLVSSSAYKPGDVITGLGGKSVEIMNTDAEGRLILADALAYATELKVDRIVDLATLTGACLVALGPFTAGLFANNDDFRDVVKSAADKAGEDVWPMPLIKKLKAQLKSPIADTTNLGKRWGGAITAGLFLGGFVGKTTWAHLDIAGPAAADKSEPSVLQGGTGFGVLTLVELVGADF